MDDVTVIGAGPYGLSLGAHLATLGKRIRVLGAPMETWRSNMPKGMHLKSEGFASSLYDPKRDYPLSRFCAERDIPYADVGVPTALQTFSDYGQEFGRRYVPMLEDRSVTALRKTRTGFELDLADGQTIRSRSVISAIGIRDYAFIPPVLQTLPAGLLSHSSAHHDLGIFAGQRVAVVGGGASAADCAALLSLAGADTYLLTRRPELGFHAPPGRRSLWDRIRYPFTTIGSGWKSVLWTKAPLVFHAMPESKRVEIARRFLGPAPGWFVRNQVENHVHVQTSVCIKSATRNDDRATLLFDHTVDGGCRETTTLDVDHVLSATGYKIDMSRLTFLDPSICGNLRIKDGVPLLSSTFESTVPGLFFTGPTAAFAFGPLLRFACGAGFAARRLMNNLA